MRFKTLYLNETVDIKLSKQKALGLTYIGWNIYINKNGQRFRWDKQTLEFHPIINYGNAWIIGNSIYDMSFVNKIKNIIEKVHKINVETEQIVTFGFVEDNILPDKASGDYDIVSQNIRVHRYSKTKYIDTIHEIGHWIDNVFGEMSNFSSKLKGYLLHSFIEELKNCESIKEIEKLLQYKKINGVDIELSEKDEIYLSYLSNDVEIFARFYSQYITNKTDSITIKRNYKKYTEVAPLVSFSKKEIEYYSYKFEDILRKVGWKS